MRREDLAKIVDESWVDLLLPLFEDPRMLAIQQALGDLRQKGKVFYPSIENVFRVFKDIPIDKVRVVIIGQDPYIKPGEAIGRAFAVPTDKPMPPSLKVIFRELQREYNVDDINSIDRTLSHWSDQGVMLLNTALTVEAGKSGSHSKLWMWFTEKVLGIISDYKRDAFQSWVVVSWGKHAQDIATSIIMDGSMVIKGGNLLMLTACHPQAQNYGSGQFVGCGHFEMINKFFESCIHGEQQIQWV